MHFECRFHYPARKDQPENLSDRIASQFGLEWRSYRVTAGSAEFMFSRYHGESDYRLDEIFLFTNPKQWTNRELTAPKEVARDVYFEFEVSEEKEDTLSFSADLEVGCNAEKKLVVFDFATDEAAVTWARIADTVLVSLTQDRALKSILFEGVSF